jgi:hypothetical protein
MSYETFANERFVKTGLGNICKFRSHGRCHVLVCRTDKRSAVAARNLRAAGFAQVSVLRRGMVQWNQTGLPVEGRTVGPIR